MNDLLFERIKEEPRILIDIYLGMFSDVMENTNKHDISLIDELNIFLEIDNFVLERKVNYKIYLKRVLEMYEVLTELVDLHLIKYEELQDKLYITEFRQKIGLVIDYLKGLLNPENEVQETPKPIKIIPTPPTGQTVLSQKQSVLLYWYLRENKMISKSVQNQHLAAAIETMTGYKSEQNQEIIRSKETDVWQLGKGSDKVTRNDFAVITSELQKLIEKIKNDGANKTK